MTFSSNTDNSLKSWQWLLANCLDHAPLYQRQDKYLDSETTTSNTDYWADDLSIMSSPSSALWQYHTALAIGATVVCSAGALMQYAETGLWQPTDAAAPNPGTTATVKRATVEDDTQVATPPIASPQAQATGLFSSAGGDRGSECKDSTCKGIEFIDQQLPEIQSQVRQLRSEMQLFQSKHTTQNLQTHRTVLAYRSSGLANRQAELLVRSQQLSQQLASTTSLLALQPDEVSQITNLLQTDANYQAHLQQLQSLENAIADEFSNPDMDNTQLGELYAGYYQIENQLRQIAQTVLANYMYVASFESPDPLWQEAAYQAPLQELMDLSHQRQMLLMEQSTLDQIAIKLTERRTELASLLKQYAMMQRELDGHNHVLQQYVAKRQMLNSELT
ncbi:hypothetical protein [Leptothoe sp. PORK10 BA2]|uniref:hypothetical protein n=1 Tax=Leptothoe sp. PORK10 BA2 TaxID=3110254 RepID=UPI002B20559B|nr:hypothetical protein [Leptothoe sp. PORK10 BA2]MEA5466128.1 hypothetical protein [Leptothoe sp. PORK10 BA2]